MPRVPAVRSLLLAAALLSVYLTGLPARARSTDASSGQLALQRDFARAAQEFGVPEVVLLAVAYHVSLWEDHGGAPSTSGGYGAMHLTHVDRLYEPGARGGIIRSVRQDPSLHTLDLAARLLHVKVRVLERDPAQNIRGGAALLARYARQTTGGRPRDPAEWYGAVARYSGSRYAPAAFAFANAVYRTIELGAERMTMSGQRVVLAARAVAPDTATTGLLHLTRAAQTKADCPASLACQYVPAAYQADSPTDPTDYGNYDVANRPKDGLAIRYIVIHDTEGSYQSAIAAFQNPTRYASANYVIRSSDGLITQMVPNADIAWHAGNYYVNIHAIGIEHEGIAIQGATWYTEQFYETSAALVRYLAHKYHIPLDRAHIVGHDQVPGQTPAMQRAQHWDPGPYWDWQHYLQLLNAPVPPPAETTTGPAIITINPLFASNKPGVTNCSGAASCAPVPAQPANYLNVRAAPDSHAPLIGDLAIHAAGAAGTTQASDWGDKVVTGEQFVRIDRQGDWDAIDFGGVEGWLRDPATKPTTSLTAGTMITPKGTAPIKVYGCACPAANAYPRWVHHPPHLTPLQYSILPGQWYVSTDLVSADYYWSPTQTQHAVVQGKTAYYQIFFNHRFAFVRVSDVRTMTVAPAPPTATPSPTVTATVTPTPSPTPTASPTLTVEVGYFGG
jgi:N-acetyl-anhydromuramyl-L-alanine amidase AmpD